MIKINKKAIASLLLSGSIALSASACVRDVREKNDRIDSSTLTVVDTLEPTVENQAQYTNEHNAIVNLDEFNDDKYTPVEGNNRYTLYTGAVIYFKDNGKIVDNITTDKLMNVTAISTNGRYTLVELPNYEQAYVNSDSLIRSVNVNNGNYTYITEDVQGIMSCNAYLYDSKGMYIGYLNEYELCDRIATNGEYMAIRLEDGTTGYVLAQTVDIKYQRVGGYAFVKAGTKLYHDRNLTDVCGVTTDEAVFVESTTSKFSVVFVEGTDSSVYVSTADLDDDFILVDLSDQKMNCYIDYQLAGSWNTRTGKDSSPTSTGAYDIDEKTTDWEFTTFPGSYAKHWMPISPETQQGIHDLVGDDEQNYGNESYHENGSHGCIRVPVEASQFVYDNYEIGDMVLVRK